MTAFLSWVYNQASKVYQWFGSSFNSLYNAAANAWNWAVDKAESAYNRATNYAYSVMQDVRNYVVSTRDYLKSLIISYVNDLMQDIRGLSDWFEYKLADVARLARDTVNSVVQEIINDLISIRNEAISLFNRVGDYVNDVIQSRLGWVIDIKNQLFGLLNLISPQTITMMLEFITQWKNAVVNFFSNPTKFIFDLLEPKFISLLCYVLAWGLGTTKYDLPPRQSWRD